PPHEPTAPKSQEGEQKILLAERSDFTVGEALRHPSFWFLSIGHGSALLVVSAVMVHLIAHLTEASDFSLPLAASIVVFMTLLQIAGQIGGGFLGDRVNKRMLTAGCMVGHASA